MAKHMYVDCDTGIDDAIALALLVRNPQVELLGIGTVGGNIDAPTAADNTLSLLGLADVSVPVAIGHTDPVCGTFQGGFPLVQGTNGLGEVDLPAGAKPTSESAPEMIVRLARQLGGNLHILALGPLTNLARALMVEPELPNLVQELTIMGGAVLSPGNVTSWAEANIWTDPEAADIVLHAGFRSTWIALDATRAPHWSLADIELLQAYTHEPLLVALADMAEAYAWAVSTSSPPRAPLHDAIAAGVATGLLKPVVRETFDINIQLNGPERGQTKRHPLGRAADVVLEVPTDSAQRIRETLITKGHAE